MFKSIHPITRIFWISLVIGVAVYQINKKEYPGSDAVIDDAHSYGYSNSYDEINACVFPAIFFDVNSSDLDTESVLALDEIAYRMKNRPEMKIEIAGMQGNVESHGMSSKREKAISRYLQANHQISASRLVNADESGEFVKPDAQGNRVFEHHESYNHNGHHYEYHYKSSHTGTKSYSYSSCNKSRKHKSSCHKKMNVKKTHRAVYITCMD